MLVCAIKCHSLTEACDSLGGAESSGSQETEVTVLRTTHTLLVLAR